MKLYKINEVREIQHYQIPKALFKHPYYADLTNDTRLAYAILLDRLELSRINNWTNDKDEVFIIYTREQMQDELKIKSRTTITKVFKQLNDFGLIREERQGLNKPNRIYVAHMKPLPIESERGKKGTELPSFNGSTENEHQEVQEIISGSTNNEHQESQNMNGINTESINTDFNKIKIDRFKNLFINKDEKFGNVFDRKDDSKGIALVEYCLKNPTERTSDEIGLTEEQEQKYFECLDKIGYLLNENYYDFFYVVSTEKYRELVYLIYGVVYDILLTAHKRLLPFLTAEIIIEVLDRVDIYQEEVDNIYAYFKASLIKELSKKIK